VPIRGFVGIDGPVDPVRNGTEPAPYKTGLRIRWGVVTGGLGVNGFVGIDVPVDPQRNGVPACRGCDADREAVPYRGSGNGVVGNNLRFVPGLCKE
jgi:hypothetical protein